MTSKGRTNAIDPMGHFWYNAKEKKSGSGFETLSSSQK
jgi:hypothetical protein